MLKKIIAFVLACSAMACTQTEPMIGGQTDEHGCLIGAGQSYSYLKQQCVQVFNVADIKLDDPDNETLAVYVILSEDRQQAEVFASGIASKTILTAVKGSYVSQDGKIRLLQRSNSWVIYK